MKTRKRSNDNVITATKEIVHHQKILCTLCANILPERETIEESN